ncbi:hypothetical protein [Chitinimonas lacunae]|uniref:Surface antigen domain-containing protein n=1 Tax=Chitinimonas lacunae TaxID=1963018 RepID=A0ABV8MNQ5_9NEIS
MQILARPQTLLSALCLGVFLHTAVFADSAVVVNPVEAEKPAAAAQTETAPQAAPSAPAAAPAQARPANLLAAALPMTYAKPRTQRQVGTWSYAVEKMARAKGCHGGAWVTDKRDHEATYEVSCDSGSKYVAVCTSRGECLMVE